MDRLCFGTFAKTLQSAMQKPNSNQAVVELLLTLIFEDAGDGELSKDFSVKAKMVTGLLKFADNVHEDIVALSSSAKVIIAMPSKFADRVVSGLVTVLIDDLIENLRNLILTDKSIAPAKRDELIAIGNKAHLADFLSATYLYAINKQNKQSFDKADMEVAAEITPLDDIARLNEIYAKYSRPQDLTVPSEPTADEMEYIAQLLAAYAEAEGGIQELSCGGLNSYPQYNNDLRQRRKEYYAAETIRRGTREVFGETDPHQFELLKEETYEGIFDVYSQEFNHGYDRLLRVMTQVSAIQINKCPLSKLPEWIGNKEKKGVCHILVNDGTIKWVVRDA